MWYYAQGEEQVGPVDEAAFSGLASAGAIRADTLVWREGMADWQAYGALGQASAVLAGAEGGVSCVECGHPFPVEETIEFEGARVCAGCKDYYFQRLREGHADPSKLVFASVAKRFVALLLDGFIVTAVLIAGFFLFSVLAGLAGAAFGDTGELSEGAAAAVGFGFLGLAMTTTVFYFTWFVGRFGATPGKMALGIKVVRSDGGPVTYLRAFARMWALELSRMVLYIGFLIACFDEEKRALHDHICDTRVVVVN